MKYSLREGIINPRLYPVLLAPASDKKGEAITSLAELESVKPYELVLDINREGFMNPAVIPSDYSRLWLKRSCRVCGRAIKNFALGLIQQAAAFVMRVYTFARWAGFYSGSTVFPIPLLNAFRK